jgi:hypothetical protein
LRAAAAKMDDLLQVGIGLGLGAHPILEVAPGPCSTRSKQRIRSLFGAVLDLASDVAVAADGLVVREVVEL